MVGEEVDVKVHPIQKDFLTVSIKESGEIVKYSREYLVEVTHKSKEIEEVVIKTTSGDIKLIKDYVKVVLAILREGYKV
jgi:hypothetical protein